ncbi:hypothetical protein C1E23_01175 [Pseudoalteromonas phenolica]|uniref:DUF2489 domain-containing protein n=1 Tax=Pseudoalteromonas phenolica TaxID=161398 RepID=A0A4Q7ITG7_9GAMM|nr:hypothetical protein [Pseudoalteromonas phenolica]RZQ54926.1 hypothetical protein C1E23_01175 [Pseudoalteromonas phenolica]
MDLFNIVGTFASIGSAIWAFVEARKSRDAASQAENVKTQIINQRKTAELSELNPLLTEAVNCCKHYTTSGSSSLIGVELNKKENEAAKIQSLLDKIIEYSEYFPNGFATEFYELTDESLQEFLNSESAEDIKKHGKQLHRQLINFSSILRKSITEMKESTVE